jgi:hypothetical protein
MNYQQKYLKYKSKYINLKSQLGGIVPHIDCDLLPLEGSYNIAFINKYISKQNDRNDNIYLLREDNLQFEKINQDRVLLDKININDLSHLALENIKLGTEQIPLHVGILNYKYNIIIGLNNYIKEYLISNSSKYGIISEAKTVYSEADKKTWSYVYNIFNTNINDNIFNIRSSQSGYIILNITSHPTVLNFFSFINKTSEFLNFILDYTKDISNPIRQFTYKTLLENPLFKNIFNYDTDHNKLINFNDFYTIYKIFDSKKDKDRGIAIPLPDKISMTIDEYNKSTEKKSTEKLFTKLIDNINNFIDFIICCRKIDTEINFYSRFKIKLENLILINWIYYRIKNNKLINSRLSGNLYPINNDNFLSNIMQKNIDDLCTIIRVSKKIQTNSSYEKDLFKTIDTPLTTYERITYKEISFANCVENTLLQIIKILSWNNGNYDINKLPTNHHPGINEILNLLNQTTNKNDTLEITIKFLNIVSGLDIIKYRHQKERIEIVAETSNVINSLSYLLNQDFDSDIRRFNIHYNGNIEDAKDITINGNIRVNIDKGHTEIKLMNQNTLIPNYHYRNLIYYFNNIKTVINISKDIYLFANDIDEYDKKFIIKKIANIYEIKYEQDINNYIIMPDANGLIFNYSILFLSILFNSIEFITELFIKYKPSINANIICSDQKDTPLFYANGIIIDILLDRGADINYKTGINVTPFWRAASFLNYDKLVKLYERGADIHICDSTKQTALAVAAHSAFNEDLCYKCCEFLIKIGININAQDTSGNTALHYTYHSRILNLLIQKGASQGIRNYEGKLFNEMDDD